MNRKILQLALPNILSNITIPLLGLVDTALMGHLESTVFLSAIALGTMVFNNIFWGFGFLRMGTVGFASQAFGEKNAKKQILILYRSIFIAIFIGLLLIVFQDIIIRSALNLSNSGKEVRYLAEKYFSIRVFAAPASLLILVFTGWFVGVHNSIFPMTIAIFSNLLNIALSSFLVLVLNLKVEGVAFGSVISQYITLIFILFIFSKRYRWMVIPFVFKEIFQKNEFVKFAKVNSDIFIRTLGIILVFSYFTIGSARLSDTILAANSVLFQFFILFSYLLDGFANAAEAISGEQIGMKNKKGLISYTKLLFLWGLGFAILYSLSYLIFGDFLISVMTKDIAVISYSKELILWIVLLPILSYPAFMWDGVFIGATASAAMRNAMIFSTLIFFLALQLPFNQVILKIWIAFSLFMFSRGFFMTIYFRKSVLKKFSN